MLVEKTLAEVVFSTRNEALKNKIKTSKNILPSVTTFNPAVPKLKEILMKNWFLISNVPKLAHIFPIAPIVAYRKDKSLKDFLVTASIPPQIGNHLNLANPRNTLVSYTFNFKALLTHLLSPKIAK